MSRRRRRILGHVCLSFTALALAIVGCIDSPQHPSTTQPVTISDVATTQPEFWYAQPASAIVRERDFQDRKSVV